MICPICKGNLEQYNIGKAIVDVCWQCGIWFDRLELQKVLDENNNCIIDNRISSKEIYKIDDDTILQCPKCLDTKMLKCYFAKRRVIADQCPKCGGIWLAHQELLLIYYDMLSERKKLELENELKNKKKQKIHETLKHAEDIKKNAALKLQDTILEMINTADENLNISVQKFNASKIIDSIELRNQKSEQDEKLALVIVNEIEKMVEGLEKNNDRSKLWHKKIDSTEKRLMKSIDDFKSMLEKMKK
jgi:Zn-finger nucleic acid-binding protein